MPNLVTPERPELRQLSPSHCMSAIKAMRPVAPKSAPSSIQSVWICWWLACCLPAFAQPTPPRCQLVPLPDEQVSFQVDGVETTRWHFGREYPRPFFYPFHGPSGISLTRMGHPGAPNHDHHRSIWIAHHDVAGHDFWSDRRGTRIRQDTWYCYRDGDDECVMAVSGVWHDAQEQPVARHDLVACLTPMPDGEQTLELQITLRPVDEERPLLLGQTNFGLLAVRVAKSVSAHFGGGRLTSSEGAVGESAIFGTRARWVDYSGPVAVAQDADRKTVVEGITLLDHPRNARHPAHWHVRDDGWMGPSLCRHEGLTVTAADPLTLRYLLHAHAGQYDHRRATALHAEFARQPEFQVRPAQRPHEQYLVERVGLRASAP
jgi:hypothetical protein